MSRSRIVRLGVAAAVAGSLVGAVMAWAPAPAARAQGCDQHVAVDDSGTTIEVGCPAGGGESDGGAGTGTDGGHAGGGRQGGGGSEADDPCAWVRIPDQEFARRFYPDAPPGAVFQQFLCSDGSGPIALGMTRWVPGPVLGDAAGAAVVPVAVDIAGATWRDVRARLLAPEVDASPAPGRGAIVGVPTFVAVSNWQGTITEERCVAGVCISLVATPTLRFDPGEAGVARHGDAPVITCDPPGTRFDPDGPAAERQAAAPGACAYAYRFRTGVPGRPDAWPGQVSVVWQAAWTSDTGESGSFGTVTVSTDVPREVDEVFGLVVDGRG